MVAFEGGATACATGSVCTELNDCEELQWLSLPLVVCPEFTCTDYSQCIPGTVTTSSASGTATSTSGTSTSTSSIAFMGGVNTAGYDFSVVRVIVYYSSSLVLHLQYTF